MWRVLCGRLVLAVLLAAALPRFAHADFINVISQTYHIHGFGGFQGTTSGSFSYDETSSAPLSRTDSLTVSTGGISGTYSLVTRATGGAFASSAFVETMRNKLDIGDGFAFGDADASITFRPLETQLIVKGGAGFVPGNIFGDVGFAGLYDDTTGQTVLQFGPRILAPEYHVFVDLSHVYTIRATSEALPGAADLAGTRLSITSAPESESVIVFLILGLGALAIVGRSRIIRLSKVLT